MNSNYLTYLEWRRDLTTKEYEFNDIDNLILSKLSYFDFNNIVSATEQEITIKAVYKKLKNIYKKNNLFSPPIITLKIISNSKRFSDMKISCYSYLFNDKKIQFAAIKIKLNETMNYISFRGTDDTLIG